MNACQRILTTLLLVSALGGSTAAAPPTFSDRVKAIEAATTAELARLEAALATTTDAAEALELQRCAAWVKLSARLALHETQLSATVDPEVASALEALVTDLRARVATQAKSLPADYVFAPTAATGTEVPSCVE